MAERVTPEGLDGDIKVMKQIEAAATGPELAPAFVNALEVPDDDLVEFSECLREQNAALGGRLEQLRREIDEMERSARRR